MYVNASDLGALGFLSDDDLSDLSDRTIDGMRALVSQVSSAVNARPDAQNLLNQRGPGNYPLSVIIRYWSSAGSTGQPDFNANYDFLTQILSHVSPGAQPAAAPAGPARTMDGMRALVSQIVGLINSNQSATQSFISKTGPGNYPLSAILNYWSSSGNTNQPDFNANYDFLTQMLPQIQAAVSNPAQAAAAQAASAQAAAAAPKGSDAAAAGSAAHPSEQAEEGAQARLVTPLRLRRLSTSCPPQRVGSRA
jgi:hypothetical protein